MWSSLLQVVAIYVFRFVLGAEADEEPGETDGRGAALFTAVTGGGGACRFGSVGFGFATATDDVAADDAAADDAFGPTMAFALASKTSCFVRACCSNWW